MRALHLNFWLHHPYKLHEKSQWTKGYFGGEADFARVNREEYQPLLALIERNSQRYPKLKVSLAVSGMWLEQAERWDVELIRRVKKLAEAGNVELIMTPYYQPMAGFYDLDELESQVKLTREKSEHYFGKKSDVVALPELCFHNKMAKWAEKAGFQAVLIGDARENLDWRSVNYLYEMKGRDNLKVICENRALSEEILQAGDGATIEVAEKVEMNVLEPGLEAEKTSGVEAFARGVSGASEKVEGKSEKVRMRKVFAAKRFQKELDLAFLRGNLVNLCLVPKIFAQWREMGVVGFFDELIKIWMETPGSKIVGPEELLKWKPVAEISLKRTVSRRGETEKAYDLPEWWGEQERGLAGKVYALREKVVAKGDVDLYRDYARLMAIDYVKGGVEFEQIWADIEKKVADVAVPRDRSVVRGGRDGLIESTAVKIKFDAEARAAKRKREQLLQMYREANAAEDEEVVPHEDDMDDMAATIQVLAQRMKMADSEEERDLSELEEAEVVADDIWMEEEFADDEGAEENVEESLAEEPKQKRKAKRKKIVIE